jgi:hypothetical protein
VRPRARQALGLGLLAASAVGVQVWATIINGWLYATLALVFAVAVVTGCWLVAGSRK